jgi:hypothetical protein
LVLFSGYHDIPWAFQALLKLEKKFYSRHHELVDSTQNNSRGQNINQGSTETNKQQPTDITQKITNAHEQHKLPNNLK